MAIAENEPLQHRLRKAAATPADRERLRERGDIEQRLAHLTARLRRRARYLGERKNLFDARRASAIQNLERLHLMEAAAAKRKVA